jgi:hypothetical protein
MPDPVWSLHPQLAADTMLVGDLALSRLLAINAADYPWLILVPRRADAVEFADLGSDAFPLTAEIGVVSLALKELTRCDKIRDRRQAWCRLQAAGAATTPGRAWAASLVVFFSCPAKREGGPRVSTVEGASA